MEKRIQIIPEEIHLFGIDIVEEKLKKDDFVNCENNHSGIAHKIMHNLEDERIKIEFIFSFSDSNDKEIGFFHIDFFFKIEHMENFYNLSEDNNPIFLGELIATLYGIAFSTSRGIIFERFREEGIENVILPVVSPQKMLNCKK